MMLAALAAFSLSACSQTKQGGEGSSATVAVEKAAVDSSLLPVKMDAKMFVDLIVDYRNSKEWDYKGDKPAVIDFYATWCGPCKQLSPILDELSAEYAGKVLFYKVDIDEERELAAVFGIQSIPMVLLIPKEGKPYVVQGLRPKAELKEAIDSVLVK